MTKDECFYIGRITKPFGVKGQVIFFLDVDDPTEYAGLDSVLVETKNGLVPYFIEELQFNASNKAIVTFEELTPDEALALVGHELYLPLDVLPKLEGNSFYFHEVVGFDVVDTDKGPIGRLESVIEYPAQPLFQIINDGKEILIPVIDEVIVDVDREHRVLTIEAPAGLIDLYLEDNNK